MSELAARALALFDDYADLSPPERARALTALAQSDPALHAMLRSLLEADDGGVLDRPPAEVLAGKHSANPFDDAAAGETDSRVGTRLGAWRLGRVVGRGGMGTVYEARRDDGEYEKRVALKCIRAELATPQLVTAFREERSLLARLDHPGIAPLIDGGVGEDGQPWFALRYIDGIALDAWCDRRRAGVRERVGLLIQACEALAYAHAQGVVHGDIKPSNLLVDDDGRVHLVDFGISTHFATASECIAVTPDYAAPEVRQHHRHGPSTDVYAMGVLSYRLLSAHWPAPLHHLRQLLPVDAAPSWPAPQPMHELLEDTDEAIAHQRAAADVPTLRRLLIGDMSAIALKAVAAQPQDRYASVRELSDDLQRWLDHQPVHAAPGAWWSRARKWRRRNPITVALGGALLLVLCASIGVSWWQRALTARESEATAAVSRLFATTLGTATLSGLGSTPFSSRRLLERTEHDLRALPLNDHPQLRAHSMATLARSYAVIGDYRRAERLTAEAERTLAGAEDDNGFVAATRLSVLGIQARDTEAVALAQALISGLGDRQDEASRVSRVVFGAELAQAQWDLGQTAVAVATVDGLVAQAERLGRAHQELLAQALILRADFLARLLRPIPAETDARRAMTLARPLNPMLADDALEQLVSIVQMQPNLQARDLARELLERRRSSLGPSHPKTAYALMRLSIFPEAGLSSGDIEQARTAIRAAYGADHPLYIYTLSLGLNDPQESRQAQIDRFRDAVRQLERKLPANNERLLAFKFNFGLTLLFNGDQPGSPHEVSEGLDLLRRSAADEIKGGLPAMLERHLMASFLIDHGKDAQLPELETMLGDLQAETVGLFGAHDYRLRQLAYFRGKLLFRQGRHDDADRVFADLVDADRDFIASGGTAKGALSDFQSRSSDLIWALLYRGLYALETCRGPQALAHLEQAARLSATAPLRSAYTDRAAHALLRGARVGTLPDLGPVAFDAAERERLNRSIRSCRRNAGT